MVADAIPRIAIPLEQTLERVRAGNPYLQVHLGKQDSLPGSPLLALIDPNQPVLGEHFATMARQYKTSDRQVLVRFYFGGFTYALASAAVGPFVVDRRVPVLDPASLSIAVSSWGAPDALILPDARFYCLPHDPAADYGDATPVVDRPALRDRLREGVIAACAPLIAVMRQQARVGARALWIAAAETCAGLLVDALPVGTTETAAREEVLALIGDSGFELRAKPEIVTLAEGGRIGLGLLGSDCCFNYKRVGESYCETCPHRSREERLAALQAWLAERGAGEARP